MYNLSSQRLRQAGRWLHEPLVGFCVLGSLIFGLDHAVRMSAGRDLIVVPAVVRHMAEAHLSGSLHRAPTAQELETGLRPWLNEEVLYREGLRLGLAQGDPEIRQRVLSKAASVVLERLPRREPSDAELLQWLQEAQSRQDSVPSLSISIRQDGKLRVFQRVPQAQLEQLYGEAFLRSAKSLPPGTWTEVDSSQGRISARLDPEAARPAVDFEKLKSGLRLEWRREDERRQLDQAVARLARQYSVKLQPDESAR